MQTLYREAAGLTDIGYLSPSSPFDIKKRIPSWWVTVNVQLKDSNTSEILLPLAAEWWFQHKSKVFASFNAFRRNSSNKWTLHKWFNPNKVFLLVISSNWLREFIAQLHLGVRMTTSLVALLMSMSDFHLMLKGFIASLCSGTSF